MYYRLTVNFLKLWLLFVPLAGSDEGAYPDCKGHKQSPIPLYSGVGIPLIAEVIDLYNYNISLEAAIVNSGHTISVDIKQADINKTPILHGGGLNDAYEAVSFHFHWGMNGILGSEHYIDNRNFNMEMHVIHKDIKIDTLANALNVQWGTLVAAFLFEEGTLQESSRGLNKICNLLPSLKEYMSGGPLPKSITLESIINTLQLETFFMYEGSLTTPPCTENVIWVISPKILKITKDCLQKFWMLNDDKQSPIVNNFRRPQQINDRIVYYRG